MGHFVRSLMLGLEQLAHFILITVPCFSACFSFSRSFSHSRARSLATSLALNLIFRMFHVLSILSRCEFRGWSQVYFPLSTSVLDLVRTQPWRWRIARAMRALSHAAVCADSDSS